MNKKLFILPILLLIPQLTHGFNWGTFYYQFDAKLRAEKNFKGSKPNHGKLGRIFDDKWDQFCKPGNQSYSLKKDLNDYRSVSTSQIINYLEGFAEISEDESIELAIKSMIIHILNLYKAKYLESFCKEFDKSVSAGRSPINPELIDKTKVALSAISWRIQQLKTKLRNEQPIDQEFRSLDSDTKKDLDAYFKSQLESLSSKPASSGEIEELYCNTQKSLNKYHAQFSKLKEYREDACTVCYDDFGGKIKRANLLCGHSICPKCLKSWIYKWDAKNGQYKPTYKNCPICRESIEHTDFPEPFLEKHKKSA